MACDATARLYDVDEDSVAFKKLQKTEKYDQGTITFQARKGRLIDLDKLHESIWATRLSGGTRSGLISLEVTAIGRILSRKDGMALKVADADAEFVLQRHPEEGGQSAFDSLAKIPADQVVKLTGVIDDYMGHWPKVLASKPQKPRRILVTKVELLDTQ